MNLLQVPLEPVLDVRCPATGHWAFDVTAWWRRGRQHVEPKGRARVRGRAGHVEDVLVSGRNLLFRAASFALRAYELRLALLSV